MDINEQRRELQTQIEELSYVTAVRDSRGWRVIVRHCEDVKAKVIQNLLNVTEPTSIVRLQERYKAYDDMLQAVEVLCNTREQLQRELRELEEDEKTREQFAL